LDNELTFLSCGSDVALIERFKKNAEDVGLNRSAPFSCLDNNDEQLYNIAITYNKL